MTRDPKIKTTVSTFCARARQLYALANDVADREADGKEISNDDVANLREHLLAAEFWLRDLEEAVRK